MKPVLIYFNPKDIPEVIEEFDKIKSIDKILFSFFPYPKVIHKAKGWLLNHPEYTHVMIASNDIVVTEENIKKMLQTAKDYPVISGVMNVENNDYRYFNVCFELPVKNINYRDYKWIKKRDYGIVQILHSGFGLMCVKRDIILKDGFWGTEKQISMDLNFSWHCYYNNIDIFCDTENIMKHLRGVGEFKLDKEPIIKEFINGK